jgi:hypothetical protein
MTELKTSDCQKVDYLANLLSRWIQPNYIKANRQTYQTQLELVERAMT